MLGTRIGAAPDEIWTVFSGPANPQLRVWHYAVATMGRGFAGEQRASAGVPRTRYPPRNSLPGGRKRRVHLISGRRFRLQCHPGKAQLGA